MALGCSSKALKMVVVGDGGCGKTCLQTVFAERHFPQIYIPTVLEKFSAQFSCGSYRLEISLWDTAGQQDYDRLRPLCYNGANVVLICYDVTNPISFQNVMNRWFPEVSRVCPGIPVCLVGCKTDLRMNKLCQRKLHSNGLEAVTFSQGQAMAHQIQAAGFLECSSKLQDKVVETFREATLAVIGVRRRRRRREAGRGCLVS